MIVFPNAKINIGLDILQRRSDGYHEISTCMMPVGWHDILEIVPSVKGQTDSLSVSGRRVACAPEKNLVMKAARRMRAAADFPNVDIYLHKIIPDGAGLGGGSSDAAYTLKALNELFSLDFSSADLAEMAADLGADCPFFIYNRPMIATGIGTVLTEVNINLTGYSIAIVKPDASVSTAEAYSGVTPQKPATPLDDVFATCDFELWRQRARNAFEPTVAQLIEKIGYIKTRLFDLGALYASMSGSGSAVFGIFDNDKLAETATKQFSDCITYSGKW